MNPAPGINASLRSIIMSTSITVQFSSGPKAIDATALRELIDSGRIAPTARVASLDGGKSWIPAGEALSTTGTAPAAGAGASPEIVPDQVAAEAWGNGADEGDPDWTSGWQRTPTQVVARLLALTREKLTAAFFQRGAATSLSLGNLAILAAALVGLVVAMINGAKSESFRVFLTGSILPILLLIGQYVANRAVGAGTRIIGHSRCGLRTRALLDMVALLALVAGVGAFAFGIANTVDAESYRGVFNGIAALLISWHVAALCFAPALTSTTIDPSVSAWKEAVGVLGSLAKIALRLVPVVFGIITVLVTCHLVHDTWDIVKLAKGAAATDFQVIASAHLGSLLGLALMPLAAFIVFAAWYATLALVESVFHIERQGDRRCGA